MSKGHLSVKTRALNLFPSSPSIQGSNQSVNEAAENGSSLGRVLHPNVMFENLHSRQPKRSMFHPSEREASSNQTSLITLQQAARDGRIDIVRKHIDLVGKDKKKLNRKDQENTTALHYAVRYNHIAIVKMLVENGAGVNVQGEHGATPLHYAARYRSKNVKMSLLAAFETPTAKRKEAGFKALRNLMGYGNVKERKPSLRSFDKRPGNKMIKRRASNDMSRRRSKEKKKYSLGKIPQLTVPVPSFKTSSKLKRGRKSTSRGNECELLEINGADVELGEKNPLISEARNVTDSTQVEPELDETEKQNLPFIRTETPTPEEDIDVFEKEDTKLFDDLTESQRSDVGEDIENGDSVPETRVKGSKGTGLPALIMPNLRDLQQDTLTPRSPVISLSLPNIAQLEKGAPLNAISDIDDGVRIEIPTIQREDYDQELDKDGDRRSSTASTPTGMIEGTDMPNFDGNQLLRFRTDTLKDILMPTRSLDTLITKRVGLNDRKEEESILLYLMSRNADMNARDHYGCTPLHYAAMRGNSIAIMELLSKGTADIEAKDRTQMTALHCATSNGSIDVAKVLINKGAELRCTDEEDMRPLHFAAMEGHLDIVELLFAAGEEHGGWHTLSKMILDEDRDGQTALHLAVENGHTDIVTICLDKGANVNHFNINLITPLHLAATSGQLEIARILVERDADIEAKNALQETPLHRAALFNRIEIVKYLLDIGAKIDCRDKDKETPLMMAVRKNNTEAVTLLLNRGADITVKDADDRTCLFIAAEEDCVETFLILLAHPEGKSLINEFDEHENTPLHIAAMKGYIKIVKILLDHGACIDAKNDQNLTPLHLAGKCGRPTIVNLLLKYDLSIVNDEEDASNTPLHLAALEGHTRVVQILLECGAAVDARNANMWTPLDCAASRGWTNCAAALLDGDSPIDPLDRGKTTPLHLASKEGHVDMVKLLLSRKADISRKDHAGRNCLDLAIENKQKDAAMAIVSNENWKQAMRNCTLEGNKVTTPMRKLIKRLPEVALKVFNNCIRSNGLPSEHPQYEITCNYEFLEDVSTDWGPNLGDMKRLHSYSSQVSKKSRKHSLVSNVKVPLPSYARKQFEMKENHPLMVMVKNERAKLLAHPLVTCLLRSKWTLCGRYVYYSKLVLYVVFLMFLTAYSMVTIREQHKRECYVVAGNATQCSCVAPSVRTSVSRKFWVDFGKYMVVILASISLFTEIAQMITQLHNYLRIHNIIEFSAYLMSLLYILDGFTWNGKRIEAVTGGRCGFWHRSIGALSVWLSWISLVLFMRKFPKLGIYVVMFTDIVKTFAQFFLVFTLFIIAFGLGFHILLYEQKPVAFATPARAMLKTTMGMLGEFEYDTVFNGDYNPMPVAWFIYVMYLVVNCIILMNLLVGLAVDDIKGVQENAVLKRLAMQVDLALDVEKALPLSVRQKLLKIEETIQPNKDKAWSFWSFWRLKSSPLTAIGSLSQLSPLERLQVQQDKLQETVKTLKTRVKEVQTQNKRLEVMLGALLEHHNISVEYEVDENHT